MSIHEPATLVTDVLLAAVAAFLADRLGTCNGSAQRWFKVALNLSAVSAVVGGTYHGFGPNVSTGAAAIWWKATLVSLHLVSAALALSLVFEVSASQRRRIWIGLIALKFAVFTVITFTKPIFLVAIADYGTSMMAWFVAACVGRHLWRSAMFAGIGLSLVAAAVQQFRWAPFHGFNHNDLYHVIQAVAFIALYRAARKLSPVPQ
ncbi:MAG: hypothetical protein ABIV50_10150 [Opitutus sp.]